MQVPAPERLIKGGLLTEAMVASVLVAKYAWHPPLYRQAQMLAAKGLDIKRSVLAFWVGYAAAELRPFICGCVNSSSPRARSRSMRRWRRCSTPGVAGSKRDSSGPSHGMTGRGAEPTRRWSPTPTLQVAVQFMRSSYITKIIDLPLYFSSLMPIACALINVHKNK